MGFHGSKDRGFGSKSGDCKRQKWYAPMPRKMGLRKSFEQKDTQKGKAQRLWHLVLPQHVGLLGEDVVPGALGTGGLVVN